MYSRSLAKTDTIQKCFKKGGRGGFSGVGEEGCGDFEETDDAAVCDLIEMSKNSDAMNLLMP